LDKITANRWGAYVLNTSLKGAPIAGNIFQIKPSESIDPIDGIVSESAQAVVYEQGETVPYMPYYTERSMVNRGVSLDVQNSVGVILGEVVAGLSPRDLTEEQLSILVMAGIIQPAGQGVMQGVINIPGYVPGGTGSLPTILMH